MRLLSRKEVRDATNEEIRKNVSRGMRIAKQVDESVARLEKRKKETEAELKRIIEYNLAQSERLVAERMCLEGEVARLKAERELALAPIEQEERKAEEMMAMAVSLLADANESLHKSEVAIRKAREAETSAEKAAEAARTAQEESSEASLVAEKKSIQARLMMKELEVSRKEWADVVSRRGKEIEEKIKKAEMLKAINARENDRLVAMKKELANREKRIESRQYQLQLAYEKLKHDQRKA